MGPATVPLVDTQDLAVRRRKFANFAHIIDRYLRHTANAPSTEHSQTLIVPGKYLQAQPRNIILPRFVRVFQRFSGATNTLLPVGLCCSIDGNSLQKRLLSFSHLHCTNAISRVDCEDFTLGNPIYHPSLSQGDCAL